MAQLMLAGKEDTMNILFINGSPNENGNTAKVAAELLKNQTYETLNLVDYRINAYGQDLPGDQLDAVLGKIEKADVLVIGSPVYWHNICGSVRNVLDRFYGKVSQGSLSGKNSFSSSRELRRKRGCWTPANLP